jgi:hypothetical protein
MLVKITSQCGHETEKNITNASGQEPGPSSLKKSIAYWSEKDCTVCWKAGLDTEAQKVVDSINEKFDLPSLEGSEKQIKWAEKCRIDCLERVEAFIPEVVEKLKVALAKNEQTEYSHIVAVKGVDVDWMKDLEMTEEQLHGQALLLSRVVDAHFWIDNRGMEASRLLGKAHLKDGMVIEKRRSARKQVSYKGRMIWVGGDKLYENEVKLAVMAS